MNILKFVLLIVLLSSAAHRPANAQESNYAQPVIPMEKYGNTLNVGLGLGYYGYVGHSVAAFHADYEFDIAKSVTLAPFINYYTFTDYYYWGDPNNPYRNYHYRETVIPIGLKGTYYVDRLLNLDKNWDLYMAASLGFILRNTTWEDNSVGQSPVYENPGTIFVDLHIGGEYHINHKLGLFLDLSTGVSTIGLAFHLNPATGHRSY